MKKIIIKDGKMYFVYSDEMRSLMTSNTIIKRVSHVEPDGVIWNADMSPVNGPVLGPFNTRQEALDAELNWLNSNKLGV